MNHPAGYALNLATWVFNANVVLPNASDHIESIIDPKTISNSTPSPLLSYDSRTRVVTKKSGYRCMIYYR